MITTKKPPSEREGDRVSGGRSLWVTLGLDKSYCIALSLSRLRRQLPPGGSLWVGSNLRGKQYKGETGDKQNDK